MKVKRKVKRKKETQPGRLVAWPLIPKKVARKWSERGLLHGTLLTMGNKIRARLFFGKAALALALSIGFSVSTASAQGRAGSETEEEAILKKAEEAFQNADYESAADLYDQAIRLDPTRVEAFVKRASLYFRQHKYDEAIDLLTRAEKLSVSDLSVKTALGLTLYEAGQRERGLTYLEEVARQRPETYAAQFQIGKHYAQSNPARAVTALDQFFRYRPEEDKRNDWEAQYLLGLAHFLSRNMSDARRFLEKAQQARPKDPQIRQLLGSVMMVQGDFAEGAAQYEPFLPEVQHRPSVAFNVATCYLHLGRRDEAKKLAQQYRSLKPEDPRGTILVAQIEEASDKEAERKEALSHYQEAQEQLKKSSETSRVFVPEAMSRLYLKMGDTAKALALAESTLSNPQTSQAGENGNEMEVRLLALGLETRIQQMNAARTAPGTGPASLLPAAEKLALLAPQDAKVLALSGSGAYAAGNFEKARKYYADALQFDGRLPRARVGMARSLEQIAVLSLATASETETKDPAKQAERQTALGSAVSLLRQAVQLDDSPSVVRNLAVALLLQGNPQEAEKWLSGANKNDPWILALHARLLASQKQHPQAVEAAERAVSEARKQFDNLPAAEGAKRPQWLRQLSVLRIELAARVVAMDGSRQGAATAKDRERLDVGIDAAQQASRDLQGQNGAEVKELQKAASRNLQLLLVRRGRQRLLDVEAHIGKAGVTAQTTKEAEEVLTDVQRAIELGGFEHKTELGYAQCLAALAGAQANQFKTARDWVGKAKDNGCELVPPYHKVGTELLSVFVQYRASTAPTQREALLRTLPRLQAKATGGDSATLLKVLRALLYSTNLALAYDYHLLGRTKQVAPTLRNAQKVPRGDDEDVVLAHNLAIADFLEGKPGAEKVLERLAPNPPEALVNLGILSDRRGDAKRALEFYRRAHERGARTPKLREWIDTKDRVFGTGQTP